MKDVVTCDKPKGAGKRAVILGFPNGTTRHAEGMTLEREPTPRTETSKYREEKKTIVIPQVVASEKGKAQTRSACRSGVIGPHLESVIKSNQLES